MKDGAKRDNISTKIQESAPDDTVKSSKSLAAGMKSIRVQRQSPVPTTIAPAQTKRPGELVGSKINSGPSTIHSEILLATNMTFSIFQ
ncbi:hypothetical protein HYFRA_00005175 [Hymenoscyphus fraxineus]|uniref:Uncharacterized protein n=1 Tax=Hymenoscyphus fraxineus TaxID=746836 RepID=A0A9N9LBT6_9HELO|nr:hypothetical protein HYFRA_00005175 [Hymenoscyphus fraxineus]